MRRTNLTSTDAQTVLYYCKSHNIQLDATLERQLQRGAKHMILINRSTATTEEKKKLDSWLDEQMGNEWMADYPRSGSVWENKKNRTLYKVIGISSNANNGEMIGDVQVIYEKCGTSDLYHRRPEEFLEKFEWRHD